MKFLLGLVVFFAKNYREMDRKNNKKKTEKLEVSPFPVLGSSFFSELISFYAFVCFYFFSFPVSVVS